MDLKDFIKITITDISSAISECNKEFAENGTIVNPRNVSLKPKGNGDTYGMLNQAEPDGNMRPVHLINFDIAVGTDSRTDGKEGVGVSVVGISLGKDKSKTEENNVNSRIQFSIPIAFPVNEE